MIIAGIDEAGRGPALGPMVIGLAVGNEKDIEILSTAGAKDSKLLTPIQREKLYLSLQEIVKKETIIIKAKELDTLMDKQSLNEIEAMKISELLNSLKKKPDIVYIDCPDTLPNSFIQRLKKYLKFKPHLIAEHKADSKYPIVSAASIFAKVERDNEIKKLEKKYGNLGSGYPSDPETIDFIKKWLKEKGELPEFARKKWATNQRLEKEKNQKKLLDY